MASNKNGLAIVQMALNPNAAKAAELILAAHPDVIFTSGRRDPRRQAVAMAANTVRYGAGWLRDTYRDQRVVRLLMTYIAENPEAARSPDLLGRAFYAELTEHIPEFLLRAPHVRGNAFDIAWPRLESGALDLERGMAICRTIEMLPIELGLQLLKKREGEHYVIHAQFNEFDESMLKGVV